MISQCISVAERSQIIAQLRSAEQKILGLRGAELQLKKNACAPLRSSAQKCSGARKVLRSRKVLLLPLFECIFSPLNDA